MAKQEQVKEVVTKKTTPPPAVYQERKSVVDSSDIVVPRLLLAQGISAAVAEGNAKMGDIRNSLTGVVLGGPNQPVTFIPITLKKYWKRFEKVMEKINTGGWSHILRKMRIDHFKKKWLRK